MTLRDTENLPRALPSLLLPLSAAPFLFLSFDSLTHITGLDQVASESFPLTAVFSLIYLAARGFRIRTTVQSSRVAVSLVAVTVIILAVTIGNVIYENAVLVDADLQFRFQSALRQGVSLLLGLSSYFMFQDAVLRIGELDALRWALRGSIPTLFVAMLQIAMRDGRVQGLSPEPSQFSDLLVFVFLPACYALSRPHHRYIGTITVNLVALLGTASTTGFVKGLAAVAGFFSTRGQIVRLFAASLVIALFVTLYFLLVPDSYAVQIITFIWVNYSSSGNFVTASLIDRFFGFVGPLSILAEPHSWFGYGLGGDTVYFDRLFDPETARVIRAAKGGLPAISSLQGKVLMYGGIAGYLCYLAAWVFAWRGAAPRGLARFMLPALLVGSVFSFGPFFLPYVWMWFAFSISESSRS